MLGVACTGLLAVCGGAVARCPQQSDEIYRSEGTHSVVDTLLSFF